MKLRNKKTGKIISSKELLTDEFIIDLFSKDFNYFISKLNKIKEEWEDYEDSKDFYYIQPDGFIHWEQCKVSDYELKKFQAIGNYFETKEEAEKALEKLKVWKRLKEDLISLSWQPERDGEFSIWGHVNSAGDIKADIILDNRRDDLDLLFGGEE